MYQTMQSHIYDYVFVFYYHQSNIINKKSCPSSGWEERIVKRQIWAISLYHHEHTTV